MPKRTGHTGGFAAQNSGSIQNCYSVVRLRAKNQTAGGLIGENSGVAAHCYSYCKLKGLTGGLTGSGGGDTEQGCYFFHNEKEGSKSLDKLSDPIRGQRLKEIQEAEDVRQLGFDLDTIWEWQENGVPLQFIPENWLFDVQKSSKYEQYRIRETDRQADEEAEKAGALTTVIHDADELWTLAQQINEGDRKLGASYIQLAEDIDLRGKEWIPIGKDRTCAFTGIFDGCGHTIKNFVIKDKKIENKGLFGFVKGGEIYNLLVDCNLKGGTCAGGIAAQNEDGIIGCCGAVIEIKGKNGTMGGLVGRNTGTIFESYSAGRVTAIIIPWWWWLPLLGLLLAALIIGMKYPRVRSTFAPVPYDEYQVPIPDEEISPNTDGNFVSFQFEQSIDVNLSTGLCKFGFKNPGNSNHNIVVQLQFTDAQAVRVMGSTGRTAEAQKKLEEDPDYDPETNRTIIAESGAIRPGYQLEDLQLVKQPNGDTVPEGEYNAMVYLVFYEIDTNNRAMLESQLPVEISVHE